MSEAVETRVTSSRYIGIKHRIAKCLFFVSDDDKPTVSESELVYKVYSQDAEYKCEISWWSATKIHTNIFAYPQCRE
jgi:hypothetical protein